MTEERFNIRVDISGKGAKSGDKAKLYSTFGSEETIILKEETLKASDIEAGFLDFPINSTFISAEGNYKFKAQLNNGDKSANSVNVALDFTGPSVGQTLLVPDSSTAKTDSGTSDNDNITNIQKPVVTFISEDNLGKSNIFIDLADGKGVAKFDTAPFDTDLFNLSSEKNI